MERMNSIAPECNNLKHIYDDCFNAWFSNKFLKGSTEDECAGLLKAYTDCVKQALKDKDVDIVEVEKRILGTEEERVAGNTS